MMTDRADGNLNLAALVTQSSPIIGNKAPDEFDKDKMAIQCVQEELIHLIKIAEYFINIPGDNDKKLKAEVEKFSSDEGLMIDGVNCRLAMFNNIIEASVGRNGHPHSLLVENLQGVSSDVLKEFLDKMELLNNFLSGHFNPLYGVVWHTFLTKVDESKIPTDRPPSPQI